jgi:hypothetical protein
MTDAALTPIQIGLTAAIVTVEGEQPAILVAGDGSRGATRAGLPFGPFDAPARMMTAIVSRDPRRVRYCFSCTVTGLPLSATMTASTLAGSVALPLAETACNCPGAS